MSNILIVDDSGTMRKIIMRGIRQAGFKVESFGEAGDGLEGLAELEKSSYDLILSDINMPNMSGLEFVDSVRERFGSGTPIVMITTEGSDEIMTEAKAKGANGYIKKPFTPDKLQACLSKLIS
jgi:two-component system, chemotaxis family, chemotaxis protein CheY